MKRGGEKWSWMLFGVVAEVSGGEVRGRGLRG